VTTRGTSRPHALGATAEYRDSISARDTCPLGLALDRTVLGAAGVSETGVGETGVGKAGVDVCDGLELTTVGAVGAGSGVVAPGTEPARGLSARPVQAATRDHTAADSTTRRVVDMFTPSHDTTFRH
jgi:hypothetical protein